MIAICPAGPPKLMKPSLSQNASAATERGVPGIEGSAGRFGEAVVVGMQGAQPGQQRLDAGRFCHRQPADIERMHDGAQACKRGVAVERELAQQHLEGHQAAAVRELRAVEVEADGALGLVRRRCDPQETRLRIDEAADQPHAGDAVNPKAPARGPGLASVVAGHQRRHPGVPLCPRFVGCETPLHLLAQRLECLLNLLARGARKVVDRLDLLRRLLERLQPAQQFGGLAAPHVPRQGLALLVQRAVLGRPVEQQRPPARLLGLRLDRQDFGMPAGGLNLHDQGIEDVRLGLRRQQVGAVAQCRRAQRLGLSPNAHAQRGVASRLGRDQQLPAARARRCFCSDVY